jgi:acyl-CoA thioesterase
MVWLCAQGTLPDEPLHLCAVTYASELTLLDAVQESPSQLS